jgi:hypothetical protein
MLDQLGAWQLIQTATRRCMRWCRCPWRSGLSPGARRRDRDAARGAAGRFSDVPPAEVGAVMIVGGNIDGFTRMMTMTIALETSNGELPLAMALGLVLVAIVSCHQRRRLGNARLVRTAGGLTMRAPSSDLPVVLAARSRRAPPKFSIR